jgi:hypothetical protein
MATGRSSGLGKLTADVRTWVPEETSEGLAALATIAGVTKGEYVRDVLMSFVHGRLTVMRLRQSADPSSGGSAGD